jgi:hypothetical protein
VNAWIWSSVNLCGCCGGTRLATPQATALTAHHRLLRARSHLGSQAVQVLLVGRGHEVCHEVLWMVFTVKIHEKKQTILIADIANK